MLHDPFIGMLYFHVVICMIDEGHKIIQSQMFNQIQA